MAIMPGKINSPVCWANGSGQDYTLPEPPDESSDLLQGVAVWRYPWQTPIGVMLQEKTSAGEIQIQTGGEFRIPLLDVYPNALTDLYDPSCLMGRRVYYDSHVGKYIVQEAFSSSTEITSPRPIYPGSATIGYINDVDATPGSTAVSIMIDPRPPTATYALALASPSSSWPAGKAVVIDPETNTISACDASSTQCNGVIAGWLKPFVVPPIANTPMVIVTSGLAWTTLSNTAFYSISTRTQLQGVNSTIVPINITGAACSLGDTGTIIVGNVTLDAWYDDTFPSYGLLDVKPRIGGEA